MATIKPFGHDDKAVLITLKNDSGLRVSLSNYGARIVSFVLPLKEERNIVLGYDSAEEYHKNDTYLGAIVGPVAGRLRNGEGIIDDVTYPLTVNENTNTLHSGLQGFDKHYFDYTYDSQRVVFSFVHKDGVDGFPGDIKLNVTYTLRDDNTLSILYEAISNKDTLFNPTNHVYFNLMGKGDVKQTDVMVESEYVLLLDAQNLPTGVVQSVAETDFDFRKSKRLIEAIESQDEQFKIRNGIDHPFLLKNQKDVVTACSEDGKVTLTMDTTSPAVVIYTHNHEREENPLTIHSGFTLETQEIPDACHFGQLGNIVLRKDTRFQSETVFKVQFQD